jgi:DnaA-homolog protein
VSAQLPLAFRPGQDQRFIDFLGQDAVRAAIEQLSEGQGRHDIILVGAAGAGKTHLLRAAAGHALATGRSAAYLPMAKLVPMLPDVMADFEGHALVCIDDVQALAGNREAEIALFHFFNRARAADCRLLFAAEAMPAALGLVLPDLVSRLEQGLRLSLDVLDEHGKRQVIARRAGNRGLQIDDAVLDYLFTRVSRDLHTLSAVLDRLDQASLAAQRRLTVPFVKSVLNA